MSRADQSRLQLTDAGAPVDRRPQTVADAMLRRPGVLAAGTTVGRVRAVFADDHVHAALLVDGQRLLAVVERTDLDGVPDDALAVSVGALDGRVIGPDAELERTWRSMVAGGRRRLAVVGDGGLLLGLLCLKRHRRGFCSADDVEARAAQRSAAD